MYIESVHRFVNTLEFLEYILHDELCKWKLHVSHYKLCIEEVSDTDKE